MGAFEIEQQLDNLSKALVDEASAARYVVGAEYGRVEALLDERYMTSCDGGSRLVSLGRSLLTKIGLHHPKSRQLVGRPCLESRQQRRNEAIIDELDRSRELIKNSTVEGVDDVAVDRRLGLRTEDCILPPLFREMHHRAEEEAGGERTFLKWMTDHASNEQLTNVWQWHDKYLGDLDSDPTFKERVSSIKAGYAEGSQEAIAAGTLHQDVAIQEPKMKAIRVVNGSPFSPVLAFANAYADRETGIIQVREGVNDFMLYHEMTHLTGGMHFEFDEGITDLMAAEVYNRLHLTHEQVDLRTSVNADQIATLEAIERMSDGKVGLYELSRAYAGPDTSHNTLLFTVQVDEAVGLPITIPMLKSSRELIEKNMATHNGGVVRQASQLLMRCQAELLAAMMFDGQGNKVASTTQELAARMLSAETITKYGQDVVFDGLNILLETRKLQERFKG